MFRIYNNTFQPIPIIYKEDTLVIPKRGKNSFVSVDEINEQVKKLLKDELVKVKEIN